MSFLTGLQPLAHNLFRIIFGFAFMTHGGQKLFGMRDGFQIWHRDNRGEMVMLFSFAFLFLATIGSGTYSVDALLAKRKPAT